MTGMEHAIEQVAEVLIAHPSVPTCGDASRDVCPSCPEADVAGPNSPSHAAHQARALAEAGLLAPAPLQEEWGVRWDDHDVWGDMYNTRHEAETGAGDEGTPVHRYVTDWEEA